jgi:tetratricopeptide (TPR) repeat protein
MARVERIRPGWTRVGRVIGFVGLGVLFVALAALQFVSSALLRDYAQPYSLVRLLPGDLDASVFGHSGARAPTPALRLLLARQALAERDYALAAKRIEYLPPSRDRAQLAGMLAQARGDHAGAIRSFLLAGDLGGLEREESRVAGSGDTRGAVLLQRQIVLGLENDRTQPDGLAEAWWRLGLAEQLDGYMHYPISSRRPWALRAMRAYEHAVALAPLSEKYLVAAGSQEINLDDDADAERYFERARDVDPTSAQAWVGLAQVALRRGDRAAARRYLQRARRIDAALPAVGRLEAKLDR